MAEMHPVLWTRVTDRRLSGKNVKVAVLSTFEHRSYELADIELTFTPQTDLAILNYIANHIIKTNRVNRDFVDKHTSFRLGNADIGYGLRPEHPLQKAAKNAGDAGGSQADHLRRLREVRLHLRPRLHRQAERRAEEPAGGAGRAVRRPEGQGHVLLDHGLQPAHARRLVQQHGLQHPPAHRQDLDARQQPVLADRPAVGLRHGARGRHLRAPPAGRHGGDQSQAPGRRRAHLEAAGGHHPRRARLSRRAAEPHAQGRQAQRLLGDGEQQHAGGGEPDAGGLPRLPQSGQLRRRLRRLSDRHRAQRRPDPAGGDVGREGRRLRQRRAPHPLLAPAGRARRARRARTCGS